MNRLPSQRRRRTLGRHTNVAHLGYLLRDLFGANCAAGAVNGTLATPGPGMRTVTDTESKLSIADGALVFGGGKASPDFDDPLYSLAAPVQRECGRVLLMEATTANRCICGFHTSRSGNTLIAGISLVSGTNLRNGSTLSLATVTASTIYKYAFVLQASNCYIFVLGGTQFPTWSLVGYGGNYSNATLYVVAACYDGAPTLRNYRLPVAKWLPTPLAYAVFGGTAGDLNATLTDAAGPDGQTTPQRTWQSSAGVWALSGAGTVAGIPALSAEMLSNTGFETAGAGGADVFANWTENISGTSSINDDTAVYHGGAHACRFDIDASGNSAQISQVTTHVIGNWLMVLGWARSSASGKQLAMQYGGALPQYNNGLDPGTTWTLYTWTLRASEINGGISYKRYFGYSASASLWWDDVSCMVLNLADLFASIISASTSNVVVDCTVAALASGTQAGLVARLNSQITPTVGIIAYFDGAGNVKVDEFTTATTWTNLISAVKAFTAGDTLRLDLSGNALRCYHITAAGAVTLIGTGTATANVNTNFGLFSTYSGNTFSKFQVFPKGTGNEYAALEAM